jgi:hypothetical protein
VLPADPEVTQEEVDVICPHPPITPDPCSQPCPQVCVSHHRPSTDLRWKWQAVVGEHAPTADAENQTSLTNTPASHKQAALPRPTLARPPVANKRQQDMRAIVAHPPYPGQQQVW